MVRQVREEQNADVQDDFVLADLAKAGILWETLQKIFAMIHPLHHPKLLLEVTDELERNEYLPFVM